MAIKLRRGTGEHSPLHIWEYPIVGDKYYIGADAARGKVEGDFSAAVAFNGNTGEMAFSFAERRGVEPFAQTLNLLGLFYNRAMMNLEVTGGDGSHVNKLLRDDYRYSNWYIWKGRDDKLGQRPGRTPTLGYETTWKSRQRLLVVMRESVGGGFLKIRDPRVVSQMGNAMRDDPLLRWEVTKGHDDLLIATALAAIAISDYPPPKQANRTSNVMTRNEKDQPAFPFFESEPSARLREKFMVLEGMRMPLAEDPLRGV
jgi:hypothetical protein